jgi:CHAT domain-containing protein/tetratricopeptide (TPR) repeat protein
MLFRPLLTAMLLALLAGAPARAADTAEADPMQRKATEAAADRLLDEGLLSDRDKRNRASARLAQPAAEGPDGVTLARDHFARGQAAMDLGRQALAVEELTKAAELAERGPLRAEITYMLSQAQINLGRFTAAIASLRDSLRDAQLAGEKVRNLAIIAEQYSRLGNIEATQMARSECVAASHSAQVAIPQRNQVAHAWRETNEIRCEIAALQVQGKYAEAAPLHRRIIATFESYANSTGPYVVGSRHLLLADNLRRQGRLADAENEARIGLAIYQKTLGPASERTGNALVNLGRILAEQGRSADGEALARKGIEVIQASGVFDVGAPRAVLADILALEYRWKEARAEFERMRAGYGDDEEGYRTQLRQNGNYALALLKTGAAEPALHFFTGAADARRAKMGDGAYPTAEARGFKAAALAALGRDDDARDEFAAAVPTLLAGLADEDEDTGNAARDQKLRLVIEAEMALLAKTGGADAAAEAFRLADAARGRGVQRALAESAVRAAAHTPGLAELARKVQDAGKQIAALNGLLSNAISARAEDQDGAAIDGLKSRIQALRRTRADNLKTIAAEFPDYSRMISPQPTTPADVQAKLHPGEAMLAFYTADDRTYAWAVPASGPAVMAVAPIGYRQMETTVAHLREALDLQVAGLDEIPAFDLAAAWGIYGPLVQPTEAAWADARLLFVVPHGPLGRLPTALLPTRPPAPAAKAKGPLFAEYREVPWLARKVAVAQLPSVGALTTLRALPERHGPRRAFIAFGDPLFSKEQAAEARQDAVTQRGVRRRSAPATSSPFTAELAQLPRLPDTAEEVQSIADVLHADPAEDLFLQARASEAVVRKLDLSKWRIVMFATHGLVPGDLAGLDQPALALTSPEVTGDGSSGLLTMEAILSLRLDADWVVLSACNTASGDGAGAEAVSGLGRAFFYAGTRALLVTNWPVETTSARMLTTDVFRRQAEDAQLTRAEALQKAMVALIDGPGPRDGAGREQFSYAHPTFWAPFSLVGDGGGINAR